MIKNTDQHNLSNDYKKKNIIYTIDGKIMKNLKKNTRVEIFVIKHEIDQKKEFDKENDYIFKKAVNFEKIGDDRQAEELYAICLNNSYTLLDFFLRYAGLLYRKGELNSVISIYRKAINIYPENSDLYANLSITSLRLDNINDAKEYAQKAIQLKPDSAYANSVLCSVFKHLNDLMEAKKYIFKSIELEPYNANYVLELSSIYREHGDINNAYEACLKAIRLDPELSNGYSILGVIQRDLGRFIEAKYSLLKAIDIDPNNGSYFLNLSAIYIDIGNLANAEKMIRKSIAINPNSQEANLNLGNILRDSGRIEESQYYVEAAIRLNRNYAIAYYALSIVARSSLKSDIYKYLFSDKILIGQPILGLSHIYFARANIRHKEKNYKESEFYLKKANQSKGSFYYPESYSLIEKSKQLKEELSLLKDIKNITTINSSNHIFIVGMPRSGSTLVESILSMNNDVFDLGEQNSLEISYKEWKEQNTKKESLTEIYRKNISYKNNTLLSTDKWLFNYQYAGLICSLMPNAKIINCFRHPLDNILSIYRANFDKRGNHFSSSIEESAKLYIDQEDTILKYKSQLPLNIYLLNYDKLVLSPNHEIRKLINWLKWDWNDLYTQPHLNKRNISTASCVQARSPINPNSLGGWKNYKELLYPAINILSKRVKYKNIGLL